ncbi:MAG: LapA family protein [Actinomycetota bacterium]|nr:LapA family protein [Actinomycetota bacterium]
MEERLPASSEEPTADARPRRGRARDARLVLAGVMAVLLVWFAVVNLQQVQIQFWVRTTTAPLIVVIVISGLLGAAVAGLWGRLRRRRRPLSGDRT